MALRKELGNSKKAASSNMRFQREAYLLFYFFPFPGIFKKNRPLYAQRLSHTFKSESTDCNVHDPW